MATSAKLYLFLTECVMVVLGFNFDTENILILDGPKKGIQFGFSSGMFFQGNVPWLIVGAPKSNSSMYSEIPQPGGLFSCPLDFKVGRHVSCTTELPAVESETLTTAITYEQQQQLLGSNILISGNSFMGCASQNKLTTPSGILYAIGRCNVGNTSDLDGPMRRTLYRKRPIIDRGGFYVHGMGMVGFSSASLKHYLPSFNTLLGAPGFYNGKGGFVLMNINNLEESTVDYFVYKDRDLSGSFAQSSYLGYAIGSGKFGDARIGTVVAGAPHYSNSEGHVGIVVLLRIEQNAFQMQTTIDGKQPGCGFGASLIVVDINGDGLHDLLVGSPFYSEQAMDQGLVQVYYGTGESRNILRQDSNDLRGTSAIHGRFGIAMADIGDINADGFNDVAIGAPYEDGQSGTVYIYNGDKENMNSKFSQRITAKSLDMGLKGFGFHISAPIDIDSNTYNDISVGAYMSDQTVVLRTRPIVTLDRYVSLTPELVPLNPANLACYQDGDSAPCLTYTVCFNFTGRGIDRINLDIGMTVDMTHKKKGKSSRMDLYMNDEKKGDSFVQRYEIQKTTTDSCIQIIARVRSLGREFFAAIDQPVDFNLNYTLSNDPVLGEVMPILDNLKDPAVTVSAIFNTGCGLQRCRSNLNIEVTYDQSIEAIAGKSNDISLTVNIKNFGEPAFATRVVTRSSDNVAFRSDQIDAGQIVCKQNGTGMIDDVACDFQTPFFSSMTGQFYLTYTVDIPIDGSLEDIEPFVSFNFTALSESEEIDPANNNHYITIPVKMKPNIDFYGSSNPEQATISPDSNKFIAMEKTFHIYNRGPSPLPETRMTIEFPRKNLAGELLVDSQNTKVTPSSSNIMCRILSDNADLNVQSTTKSPKPVPEKMSSENVQQPSQSIQNMTCNRYECVHVECLLSRLDIETKETVTVIINITEASLTFDKNAERLNYVTTAEIHKPQHSSLPVYWPETPLTNKIRVDIYPALERKVSEEIEIWILIVGCLGGLLLFVALGLLLWKCGFFKRKKREEVQAFKRRQSQRQSAIHRKPGSSNRGKSGDPTTMSFLE